MLNRAALGFVIRSCARIRLTARRANFFRPDRTRQGNLASKGYDSIRLFWACLLLN